MSALPNNPVGLTQLEAFVSNCLASTGMADSDTKVAAEALVMADSMGVHTHGTKLLAGYIGNFKVVDTKLREYRRLRVKGLDGLSLTETRHLAKLVVHFQLMLPYLRRKTLE